MDHHRPIAIVIPLETWPAERSILMERYAFLHSHDLDLVPGREDELIQRLQRLLYMARQAVVDLDPQPLTMAREKILFRPAQADADCIRVRLDSRTIVLIRSMKKFAYWKERYPDAVVLEPVVPEQK